MKNTFKIFVSFLIILLTIGCSTKKDAFINRSYHSITTKYNVLHNGNEAFRVGLEQLNENYEDDFWNILPIEPLKVDELAIPGIASDTDSSPKEFEKAEEKAVKAVQKHSMLIARKEKNNQIDDAYLLLGKSRYYSKRFVPALEAFNYVIINYPNADLINETRIWQSKTHIRLQNEDQAIENLKLLLKNKNLSEKIKEDAHTAIAMAYTEKDSIRQVIDHLNKAVITDNNKEQTARNLYILGQLYQQNKLIDSSNIAYQKVIDLKRVPYKYKIHAQIEKAKNVSTKEEAVATIETLKSLIKDRDNRPYLGELYYQLAMIEKESNLENAITDFKKSLQSESIQNFQKELSFEEIGNIYFDKADFITAGAYYDSILQITDDENSKRVRRLKRRRNNLDEVIFYENIAKVNDSILNIVSMSKDEQSAFFTSYIEKLKEKEAQQQKKITTGSGFLSSKNNNSNSGKWYFYNIQTVGFGEQEFKRIWGNRPLEDNWRLSEKTQLNFGGKNVITQNNTETDTSKNLDLSYYLDKIPTNQFKIDSIKNDRNNAYYKLGIIYKEQFKEVDLAADKLEKLLVFNPNKDIELPAKYHLFKIYESKNSEKANSLKNDIITNYTNSKYAKIISNPNQLLDEGDKNSPESEYESVYYEYKDEKFESVITKSTQAISKYEGQSIVPKFELLKAYAIGKKDGVASFKEALEFVAVNYPNTEEGKKAQEVIETIKAKI
ncbi:tetratricopeptide repeat protein [Lutibacter sp. B1]|uniref:type IX secretion system periplasmic lipoprotein PorW/SprE n=1 Tax=Lutibacter sp. B1 TaxID=2725996 RepID=UPI00145784B3|nr:tetratricopeptide repeat protein [Lutibacter sp. B1]NLP57222.1 hypothetical protein [Lutibacter sp. B1]